MLWIASVSSLLSLFTLFTLTMWHELVAWSWSAGEDCPPSTVICPFTNKNGKFQCPECHARVHDDAWHSKEDVAFIKMARNVINHNVFSATVEQTPDDDDNNVFIQRAVQRLQDARVLMVCSLHGYQSIPFLSFPPLEKNCREEKSVLTSQSLSRWQL